MTDDLRGLLDHPRFPRSSNYDVRWIIDNQLGPHPLWLVEWLTTAIDLPVGARVLDLGCGRAMTSIFLAREFGVRVVAADLWVPPQQNWIRVREAGCADSVMPVHAEAHDLKFAEGYFDAILCVDAYHYFGTNETYLPYLVKFLRPGGTIGIALPSIVEEFVDNEIPEHLQSSWSPDWWTFHSPLWWRQLWERNAVVEVERAELLEEGWRDWARWYDVRAEVTGDEKARCKAELARLDAGRNLGFARVVARRPT
jgi:cyclopropane fatty-acyl-phospholipid synthase-like methyltransferase